MSYNGWSNRETWVVNVWFGDSWERKSDVDGTRDYIDEELDDMARKMPGWMTDLLGINFRSDDVDWDELKDHVESDDDQDDEE